MTSAAAVGGTRRASRTLVGRGDALTRLESLVDEAVATQVLVPAVLEGPAGIGKTRVVDELARRLGDRDVDVLVGHCVALGETLPFAPLVEVLSVLVRRDGAAAVRRDAGAAAVELGRLVPALLERGELPEPGPAATSRLFQALSTLLANLSGRRPLVLVVEDVHWADASTRDLVGLLARQQHGAVLLLLTLRTDESPVPPGLSRYLAELARRGEQRVRLDPLTRDEQARQLSDILGVPPRRDLLDHVYARAEGNPFFAEELLALGDTGPGELPATIRDLLLVRLESLQPATRQVLRTASLVGREVPHRLLEAVADVTGERLESALREAIGAHVLHAEADALVFRHALLQEAIAASLLPGEAARAHRRLAETLTRSPELAGRRYGGVAGRLARHWDAAGEPEQALSASVAAGREASDALAFAEALRHYERALQLWPEIPDAERLLAVPRARLLRWVAEVAHLSAHPDRATELVREAIDCAGSDDQLRGWLHERLGRYLWMAGDGRGALRAYQRAVELVPAEPPTRARAAVLSGLSQILMLADRHAESEDVARQAIAVAQQVPDGRSIEGHARCNLGCALGMTGRVDDGIAELRTAIRIADEELDDVDENARALVNLASVLHIAGRVPEGVDVALEAVRVGDELGLRRRKGVWCRCDAGLLLTLLGRLDEAEVQLAEAGELDPQGVDVIRLGQVTGLLRIRQGDLSGAREHLERSRSAGGQLLDPQLVGPLYTGLAEVALLVGDADRALAAVADGLALGAETWQPFFALPLLTIGVAAAMSTQRTERAAALLERAEAVASAAPWCPPAVDAELADARAWRSGAPADWTAAADRWDGLADGYRAAWARLRAAEALLSCGDRQQAGVLLGSALATGRSIGARHLASVAEDVGRRSRLHLPGADEAANPYRLTAREREVLGLVADGLTDRAIGGRLFISHRTVERHVSNLLAKLDATRRSELVATAHREGLLHDSSAV